MGDLVIDEDARRIVDNEAIQRARLRVDIRKWLLSKLAPKKYGDKLTTDVTVRQIDTFSERFGTVRG